MIPDLKYIKGKLKLWREVIFSRLSLQTVFADYDLLLTYIKRHQLYNIEGNVVEIGAFMGGGTRKLGEFFRKFGKTIIVVDIFDPSYDHTKNDRGEAMSVIYNMILGNRNLTEIFNRNIEHLQNIDVRKIDSKNMPNEIQASSLCFSVIDGNHNPLYVENDFKFVWERTVKGGAVALHDYGGDLPQVTTKIDELIKEYSVERSEIEIYSEQCFIIIKKLEETNK